MNVPECGACFYLLMQRMSAEGDHTLSLRQVEVIWLWEFRAPDVLTGAEHTHTTQMLLLHGFTEIFVLKYLKLEFPGVDMIDYSRRTTDQDTEMEMAAGKIFPQNNWGRKENCWSH